MLCKTLQNLFTLCQCSCVFFIPLVLSNPTIPGLKRSKITMADFTKHLNNRIRTERIKESILRNLNMSEPPVVKRKTLPNPEKKLPKGGAYNSDTSLIFSEATDPYKKDYMVFKVNSDIRTQLSHAQTAFITIRLRLYLKRSSSAKDFMRTKAYQKLCKRNNLINITPTNRMNSTETSNETSSVLKLKKLCARLSKKKQSKQGSKSRAQRKLKRLFRSKGRKIKLIVRVLDPKTNKRRKIFTTKVSIKKKKIVEVSVSQKVFEAAAESKDHSLVIQVSCRNCKRFVKMNRVYRDVAKRKKSNSLLLNPNRPILYFKTISDLSNKAATEHRSKRHASPNLCPNIDTASSIDSPMLYDSDLQCCGEKMYFSFKELGLDHIIVHPQGFSTIECFGKCRDEGRNIRSVKLPNPETSNAKYHTDPPSDLGKHQSCVPQSHSSLDILYFANSTTIIPKRLFNFIAESCGCSV